MGVKVRVGTAYTVKNCNNTSEPRSQSTREDNRTDNKASILSNSNFDVADEEQHFTQNLNISEHN